MNWFRKLAAIVQEGSLYVLLFLLPFSKAAIEIMFGVLFISWLIARLDPTTRRETVWRRLSLRPLVLAIAGYLAVCALSITVSRLPWLSLRGLVNKWVEYLLLFMIVADVAKRPQVLRRSLRVLAYASVGVVIEAISQERYGRGFFVYHRLDFYGRMTGPYENPIDLATYLMVTIPLLLAYAATRPKASRWPIWLLLSLLVGCLARTEAVGAWLGLGVGVLVMMTLATSLRRPGLVLLVGAVLSAGVFLYREGRVGTALSIDTGTTDRWHMWQAAIGMIRDRPVLGHGLNTFMANYLDYWVGGERQPRYAHNCYLQVAAETGILGLLTFMAILTLLFARVVDGLRRVRSRDRVIRIGLLAGLLAFALQAGVDTNFYALRQAALFWTVAGLAVGLSDGRPETSPRIITAATRESQVHVLQGQIRPC